MIHDTLANSHRHRDLPRGVSEAFAYLRRTDFAQTPDGRYELDGQRLVAIVRHCDTKPPDQAVWEAHRRHIDVHYVIEGAELVGYLPWREGLAAAKPYDEANDADFYDVAGQWLSLPAGSFIVFTPDDVHASDVAGPAATAAVRKVIMKCRTSEG